MKIKKKKYPKKNETVRKGNSYNDMLSKKQYRYSARNSQKTIHGDAILIIKKSATGQYIDSTGINEGKFKFSKNSCFNSLQYYVGDDD